MQCLGGAGDVFFGAAGVTTLVGVEVGVDDFTDRLAAVVCG